jgi:hypothetical protein
MLMSIVPHCICFMLLCFRVSAGVAQVELLQQQTTAGTLSLQSFSRGRQHSSNTK